MTVPKLINQQMDYFIGKLIVQNQLSHGKVIEVAKNISAYLIRTRHIQNKVIATEEINLVLQSTVDFLNLNFENQFIQEDFVLMKDATLALLKNPSFDAEIQDYFATFYN